MQTTVRCHMNPNETNLAHNTDEKVRAKEDHIKADPETGHTTEKWCINYCSEKEAVATIFAEDLKNYNKKTRKSRQMTMKQYIQKVKDDKRGKGHKVRHKNNDGTYGYTIEKREEKRLSYELVFSCGNTSCEHDKFGRVRYRKGRHVRPQELPPEVNYAACKRYFETFEERNQNFKIISCVWHNEEGFFNRLKFWEYAIAHAHLVFLPIGTGYKQGMERQVSIGRALENMGYVDTYEDYVDENGETQSRWVCAYTLWERAEAEYLEQLLQEEYEKYCKKHKAYAMTHGKLEIIHPVKGRNVDSLSPKEYAEKRRLEEEIAELSGQAEVYKETLSELADKAVIPKKNIFKKSKKIILSEDELAALKNNADVVKEMEFNKISGIGYSQKAKKEWEAAEEEHNAVKKLYQNEEQHIRQQAQLIANKMQQDYEKDTGNEKKKYSELVENEKSYILTYAKLISEKTSLSFAKLDEQEKRKLLSHIYKELDLDNIAAKANEPELSF